MKKILVIDDSETVRQQVRQALATAGYNIVEAVDGVDGLEKLRGAGEGDVALALCDVNMPRMNGLEMLEKLAKEGGRRPPVIMLTTEGQPALMQRAKAAGARGWMVKPFKADTLLAAVKKLAA